MASNHLQRQEPTGHGEREVHDPPPTVTGPHAGYDRYGHLDHYYYRCERCGLESTDATLADGCRRCRDAEERR